MGAVGHNSVKPSSPAFSLFYSLIFLSTTTIVVTESSSPCSVPVIPTTKLVTFLERVQETALNTFGHQNFDPKDYVDLSLKHNLSITIEGFERIPKSENGSVSAHDLNVFIASYFDSAGSDVVYHEPEDFVPVPEGFLPKVKNHEMRRFALEVHSLWKNLSRKVSGSVHDEPELHTLLPLPNLMVIPGSRFREVYYWDSYWVIRGLLVSKMYDTAKAIVGNLLSLVDTYGYVLNGSRAYYTNRSQPPLLSSMIHAIYERTGDMELVKNALPRLLKEYEFWTSGIHSVTIQDAQGCEHNLSRYYARWNQPRPESSTTDKKSASNLTNDSEKERFYREVASTAESGWDFSSRWMRNASEFTTLSTTSVLPVDLNAFILKMELDITSLAKATRDQIIAKKFSKASQMRKHALNSIFWNDKMGQWLDYWNDHDVSCKKSQRWKASNQNHNIYASNFIPLWIDLFNSGL
jgi:alpha,alpha-trehalase